MFNKLLPRVDNILEHPSEVILACSFALNLCLASLGYNVNFNTSAAITMAAQLGSTYCCLFTKV